MFFHVSRTLVNIGTVINPGSWGNQVRVFKPGGPMPTPQNVGIVLWEVALEAARVAINPDLPSRLSCIFATETLEHAQDYRDRFRVGSVILSVAPLAEPAAYHRGNYNSITTGNPQISYAEYMPGICRSYWEDDPGEFPEVLYPDSLTVLGIVG